MTLTWSFSRNFTYCARSARTSIVRPLSRIWTFTIPLFVMGCLLVFDFLALFHRDDVLPPDPDRIAVPLFSADQTHHQEKCKNAAEQN
jgi:hypothetical protein